MPVPFAHQRPFQKHPMNSVNRKKKQKFVIEMQRKKKRKKKICFSLVFQWAFQDPLLGISIGLVLVIPPQDLVSGH